MGLIFLKETPVNFKCTFLRNRIWMVLLPFISAKFLLIFYQVSEQCEASSSFLMCSGFQVIASVPVMLPKTYTVVSFAFLILRLNLRQNPIEPT